MCKFYALFKKCEKKLIASNSTKFQNTFKYSLIFFLCPSRYWFQEFLLAHLL